MTEVKEKMQIPFSLLFLLDEDKAIKHLEVLDIQTLISLYKEEGDWRVRQAMAPELAKRSDLNTQTLISLYKEEGDWRVRQAMASELGKRSKILEAVKNENFIIV